MSTSDLTAQERLAPLISLLQLEAGAAQAYRQAIVAIDISEIRERLEQFRDDHDLHAEALASVVRRLGGNPPEPASDIQAYLIEGYTAVRAAMGIAGALRALKSNEVLTNARYEAALALELPGEVRGMLARHREEERRHLAYVEAVLEDRVWEIDPSPGRHGRFTADLGQLVYMGIGGALVLTGVFRPSLISMVGATLGAAMVAAALQSGVDPGGLIAGLTHPSQRKPTAIRSQAPRSAPA